MVNDVYMEYIVKRTKGTKEKLGVAGIIALAVILTFVMIILIFAGALALTQTGFSQFAFSIGLVLIAFMWYFAVFFMKKFNVEYEYILTNSAIDIDKIMSKSQRKRIISFDFAEVEIVANINDDAHNAQYKNQAKQVELYDLTGDASSGGVYFVDFTHGGKPARVLFQPTSRMIEAIRKFNPRNVFIYEDRF